MNTFVRSLALLVLFITEAFSQSLSIGLGGGVSAIQGDNFYTKPPGRPGIYSGPNGTVTNAVGLNLGAAPIYAVEVKYRTRVAPIDIVAGVRYIPMRGNGGVSEVRDDPMTPSTHPENVTMINDVWSYRLGLRGVYDMHGLTMFLGASATIDDWKDAKLRYEYQGRFNTMVHYTNGLRYGADVDGGIGYRWFEQWETEASVTYSFLNEWGRRNGEVPMNTLSAQLTLYYTIVP